jgi:DNA-binding transcriptional ArsR family regulator
VLIAAPVNACPIEHLNGHAVIVRTMAHGRLRSADHLDTDFARAVADTMQALATTSRVRLLGRLRAGAASVNELAEAVEMEPSAVSHQLRLLRHLGFVVGRREGRRVVYDLHDDHVAHLLDEAVSHVEHVQLGLSGRNEQPAAAEVSA